MKYDKQSYPWQILRAMPVMTVFYSVINVIRTPGYDTAVLLIALIYDKIINVSLKTLAEYGYDLYGKEEHAIIGRGKRPEDAKNTACFLKYPEKASNTFGMPSGHSQNAWLFATYLIMHILHNNLYFNNYSGYLDCLNNSISNKLKILSMAIIIFIALMTSSSRVIEKCHTKQQVIVGGLIGCILGYYTFLIEIWIQGI
jgi:membrane-associated phospholipid phosphatase